MLRIAPLSTLLAATALASSATAQVRLNECFVSHTGTDTSEFIEIKGPASTSLNGYMVLVVESDVTGQGTLDRIYDLSAGTIGASGFYVLGTSTLIPAPDQNLPLASDNFENSSLTIYLIHTTNVATINAMQSTDIRNPPGSGSVTVLPTTAGVTIHDLVAIVDSGISSGDVAFDGALAIGPDLANFPAGVLRCCDAPNPFSTTEMLDFGLTGSPNYPDISPGATNATCMASCAPPGTPFCFGDGTGTFCPCSPAPVPHGAPGKGCPTNIFAGGAQAAASGNPSLSADTLVLTGTDMINGSMIFYQGATQQSGGLGVTFGDGLRCIVATGIKRFKVKTVVGNTASYPGGGDNPISVAGMIGMTGTLQYQGWYRSANPSFCTAATFNLTNGLAVTWAP